MNDVRDDAWDRRLDAGLAENEGGVQSPDVTAVVLARVATGDSDRELHALPSRRRESRWLAAAVLLLGIGVVAGVWASRRSGDTHEPAQSPAGVRDWRTVSTRAEIDALPADVKFVDGLNLGDDDVAALTRCTQLEGLRLRHLGSATDPQPHALTPAAQTHLRRFAGLRALEVIGEQSLFISKRDLLTKSPLLFVTSNLDVLTDLPLLVELRLEGIHTDDAALSVLDRLPALRSLDLALNHGFTNLTLQRLASLPELLELRLYCCSQLSLAMLAPIAKLRRLQKLDLGGLDLSGIGGSREGDWKIYLGPTPAVDELVPNGLLSLGLSRTKLDDATMEALLLRLPKLRMLDLSWCRGFTPAVIGLLAASPLRSVRLQGVAWLTDEVMDRLQAAGITVDGVPPPQEPKAPRDWRTVSTRAEIGALPPDAKFVDGLNLGDDDFAALTRCTQLVGLRLRRLGSATNPRPYTLTPAAQTHLRRFAGLRALEVIGEQSLFTSNLDVLIDLPLLVELRLEGFETDDAALGVLDRLPALRSLDLALNHGFTGLTLQRLARLPGLLELRLYGCSQLSMAMLAPIAELRRLRKLDLGGIGEIVNGGSGKRALELERDIRKLGLGLTPAVAELVPNGLLSLGLSHTKLDDAAMEALLRRLSGLEVLDLSSNSQITDLTVASAVRLPRLRMLDLSGCRGLTPAVIGLLAASPLRSVRLQGIAWLTTGLAHRLMAAGKEVDGVSQQVVEPAFATVRSLADVQALAADTTAVDALDLGADGVAALPRLRGLERLRLRYGEQAQGDGEWVAPHTRAGNSRSLGDADLAPLAALDALTSVELMGTVNLRGDGIRALAKLPKLAALRLSCFDVDDATMAAVARFPALRSLRIELVLGFAGEGMRAIAAAPRLEELTIAHCPQLSADDIAALGRCTSLTSLAIRQLTTLRNDNDRQLRDDESFARQIAQAAFPRDPALTDRALMGLQKLTSLRRLELTWGSFTSMALQTLADMRRLEYLDLTGNGELVPSALAHVPATVQTLRIGDCDGLDDHAAEVIRDSLPVLRELWLSHDAKLTDAFVETVLQIPSLRTLNIAQCTGLTARTGELLLAARNLAEVDITGTRFIAQPLIEQLRSQGKRVRYAAW